MATQPTREVLESIVSAHFVPPVDTNIAQARLLLDALIRFDDVAQKKGESWRKLTPEKIADRIASNLAEVRKGGASARQSALDVINYAAMALRAADGDPDVPEPDLPPYESAGLTEEEVEAVHAANSR